MRDDIPSHPRELTPAVLTGLISELHPGTEVQSAEIVKVRNYGDADSAGSVSTSTQVTLAVRYSPATSKALPKQIFVKMSVPDDIDCSNPELGPLFENEVAFYRRLRAELDIEAPLGLGGRFDPNSGRFVLILEDLSPRSPHINSMMDADNLAAVEALLESYARLHARFWGSSRFGADLSWVQGQVTGEMEEWFDKFIREHVINELAREKYKREFVEEAGTNEAELYFGEKALKRHHAGLAQTLLHGDAHFGNTYLTQDGRGGLLDWQVNCRGFAMFDVGYLLHTALSVHTRRLKERELLAFYRDRLCSHGVQGAPDSEVLWTEYRRTAHHSFYLGWLTAPRENYGLEVCVLGNHRTKAAYQDLEARRLIKEIM